MKLNPTTSSAALLLLLPGLLLPTTYAFTTPAVLHITKGAARHPVMSMATSGALDSRMGGMGMGMGGLARLLDEMTADPFLATPGPSSLWKRLDMSAPAMAATIRVDVKEVADAYEIHADLPGVKKEDIKLSFSDNGALTIEAERRESKEESQPVEGAEGAEAAPKYFFKETTYGKVYRSFKLPQNADTANVNAKLSDGVLSVSIPKRALPTERTIEIK